MIPSSASRLPLFRTTPPGCEKLRVVTAALNKATMEYVPFITGRRPNIRLIE